MGENGTSDVDDGITVAKKQKTDQLSVVGVVSAVLKNTSQQRSLAKTAEKHAEKREARRSPERIEAEKKARKAQKKAEKKANKDTRSPEEIGASIDTTRERLVDTVDALKYDLDVPARLAESRDRVAARLPRELRGQPQAIAGALAVLTVGWGALAWAARAGAHRSH